MRNGPLRHRLTYQEFQETKTPTGAKVKTWTTIGTYWSEVKTITAREREVNDKLRTDATHVVRHKSIPVAIRSGGRYVHRIKGVERFYNVVGVVDVGNRGIHFEVTVNEVTA